MLIAFPTACRRPRARVCRRPRSRAGRRLALGAASGLALLGGALLSLAPRALHAQESGTTMPGLTPEGRPQRPPGFVLLEERQAMDGLRAVGVFGPVADPVQPGLWRVQLWEERDNRVIVATDKVSCSRTAPLRITGRGRQLIVRELNPGGPITAANRLDHLIWWAVCQPAQGGRDPATLASEARRLGFDGRLPEREQILPAP